jgi:hypothetical protein
MAKKDTPTNEMNQFVPAGLKWLAEMEAVNSPVLLNMIYGNIYSFPNVADAEILIDRFNKRMLVYIKFTWFVRKYWKTRKKLVSISILDGLQELLPSFEFRIIEDKPLFDLAVQRMKESVLGGKSETVNKPNDNVNTDDATVSDTNDSTDAGSEASSDSIAEATEAQPEANEADKEESPETQREDS